MTRKETIKGIVGVFWAISVALCWLPFGDLIGLSWAIILVFIYIMQLAVVSYAHNFLHNKNWYSVTLITLCVSNVLNCIAFAVTFDSVLSEHIAQDAGEGFVTFEFFFLITILGFLIIYTSVIIACSIISYHKRKGSFK